MCPRTKLIDVIMNEMGLRESAKESGTGKGCIVAYASCVVQILRKPGGTEGQLDTEKKPIMLSSAIAKELLELQNTKSICFCFKIPKY